MPAEIIAKPMPQPAVQKITPLPTINRQKPGARPLAQPKFNKNRPVRKKSAGTRKISAPIQRVAPTQTKPRNKAATLKWWNGLSQKDQAIYIKQHPKTALKPTRKLSRPRLAQNQRLAGGKPKSSNKHATVQPAGTAPATPPKKPAHNFTNHHRFLHKLFGHAHRIFSSDHRTSKLIDNVERGLSKHDHELLDQAKEFAKKHPEIDKPPHHFRKALLHVMAYTLLASAGAAIAGPAGVLLVTHTLNEWKNHGGGLDKFAWNALRGRKLDGDEDDEPDKHERPVNILIKSLRLQLQQSKNEADKERIHSLIDELEEQVEQYQENKDAGLPTPTHTGGHKSGGHHHGHHHH